MPYAEGRNKLSLTKVELAFCPTASCRSRDYKPAIQIVGVYRPPATKKDQPPYEHALVAKRGANITTVNKGDVNITTGNCGLKGRSCGNYLIQQRLPMKSDPLLILCLWQWVDLFLRISCL